MPETRTVLANLTDLEGMAFEASMPSGHTITLDASGDHGGRGRGPSPMEVLLASLAGCTGMDVISLLRKMRQDVTGYQVRVTGTPTTEHPRIYETVDIEHVVTGRGLEQSKVDRAVELSATRYCPVSATLNGVGMVTHRATIIESP